MNTSIPESSPSAPSVSACSSSPSAIAQHTLCNSIQLSGVGLHSGEITHVCIHPAPPNTGRYFVRVDLPDTPIIPAQIDRVSQTLLSTELRTDTASIRTVEHLLAALAGVGVDNARIEIDGSEVPLLDGSAQLWVEAIASVGITSQDTSRPRYRVQEPLWVRDGDAFVAALPSDTLRFTYGIEFDSAAIGSQWCSWSPEQERFEEAIAPARTFGLAHQVDYLRQQGLIKGGSLDNALVCDDSKWLNPPLRFSNEPVRHKLLDLVGDISLLGYFPIAHVLAYKASHRLHAQLAAQLNQLGAMERLGF